MSILEDLTEVLEQRKGDDPSSSYVASLYAKGTNKILEKIGEEATEVIIAAKEADDSDHTRLALVSEMADLWFHSLVLLAHKGLSADDVLNELQSRFGTSGHEEKASREQ